MFYYLNIHCVWHILSACQHDIEKCVIYERYLLTDISALYFAHCLQLIFSEHVGWSNNAETEIRTESLSITQMTHSLHFAVFAFGLMPFVINLAEKIREVPLLCSMRLACLCYDSRLPLPVQPHTLPILSASLATAPPLLVK